MKTIARIACLLLILSGYVLAMPATVFARDNAQSPVVVLTSEGSITPVLIEYLERGLKIAGERGAQTLILQLDTPGGSVDIMNKIVQIIRNSDIPVVVYVSPRNAMAGSAGTVITLAGHVAAMAPETTIGAASPVGSEGEDIGETMEAKLKEILKASVRGLTKNRSEEATRLAEETIENARAVTVEEALQAGLVDILAADLQDLLEQLDGWQIEMDDEVVALATKNAPIIEVKNTFIEEVLLLLVNPNLVFLLLSVGIQAILIEISSPGGWVAGFIGAICLMLAVYGLGILPVNWFGLLFLLVAFVLFILDIKAPTKGALTAAGATSFVVGALVLFNTTTLPGFPRVSVPLVVGTGVFIAGSFFAIVTFALRAQRRPVMIGKEALPGKRGVVEVTLNPRGMVQVAGEQWAAEAPGDDFPIEKGEMIEVLNADSLVLRVRRMK